MTKGRLEAFSDGVLAIIITIMVLELKPPHSGSMASLVQLWPVMISYVLSFIYVGIYWNNHHHMLQATNKINGSVLWANLHLLFWLSLFPFVTAWMGENHFHSTTVAVYGIVLFMAALAYFLLARCLKNIHGHESAFTKALGNDRKGQWSLLIYLLGIGSSFIHSIIGFSLYVLVAIIWFVPDRRFEKK